MKLKYLVISMVSTLMMSTAAAQHSVGLSAVYLNETIFDTEGFGRYEGSYQVDSDLGIGVGYIYGFENGRELLFSTTLNSQMVKYDVGMNLNNASFYNNSEHQITKFRFRLAWTFPLVNTDQFTWSVGPGIGAQTVSVSESIGNGYNTELSQWVIVGGDSILVPGLVFWEDANSDPRTSAFNGITWDGTLLTNFRYRVNEQFSIRLDASYFRSINNYLVEENFSKTPNKGYRINLGLFYTLPTKE